ncbi:Ras-like protein family member 11B [Myotis davidii]|uniref:small monomeric GTPase n=1 Tax=Myotis davidii TaxID=225400 RepID=L5M8Z0_MYODS|nr:Ras-like protein family member 11B [Myotis davidii]
MSLPHALSLGEAAGCLCDSLTNIPQRKGCCTSFHAGASTDWQPLVPALEYSLYQGHPDLIGAVSTSPGPSGPQTAPVKSEWPQGGRDSPGEVEMAMVRPGGVQKVNVTAARGLSLSFPFCPAALVVRFLTKRFIGDYERNAGNLYTRQVQIEGETLAIQVQDTPGIQVHENSLSGNEQLSRCIRWADAVVIVFSITDYKSYELIGQLHQQVQQLHLGTRLPVVVVANKADLLHIKQVDPQLGLQLAGMLGCSFYEVSVSENYNDVYNAFHVLCKEVSHKQPPSSTPEKRRTSLIPRPKSPNMQDLKRRFKQALSAKVRTVTSV